MEKATKEYTPEYKWNMVMEVLKEENSIDEIAACRKIPRELLESWRDELVNNASAIFDDESTPEYEEEDNLAYTDAYKAVIFRLRIDKKMSQQEVAEYLGISRTMYARYESGKTSMPVSCLVKLTRLYGVSADYILGLEN